VVVVEQKEEEGRIEAVGIEGVLIVWVGILGA